MTVVPPAVNAWDTTAIAAAALKQLGINPGDDDVSQVTAAVNDAVSRIDTELDWVPSDELDENDEPVLWDASATPALFDSAVALTVELYQRTYVRQNGSVDPALLVDGTDPMTAVRAAVGPSKTRWGLA